MGIAIVNNRSCRQHQFMWVQLSRWFKALFYCILMRIDKTHVCAFKMAALLLVNKTCLSKQFQSYFQHHNQQSIVLFVACIIACLCQLSALITQNLHKFIRIYVWLQALIYHTSISAKIPVASNRIIIKQNEQTDYKPSTVTLWRMRPRVNNCVEASRRMQLILASSSRHQVHEACVGH